MFLTKQPYLAAMEEALVLAPTRSAVGRRVRLRRRLAAGGVAALVAANAGVIVWLWIHGGNLHAKSTGDVLTSIGTHNGDTLNLQWAYLRDKPPTSPTIGHASKVAPPLPWANRDAVLRRDAEIRAIREEMQRGRNSDPSFQEGRGDNSRETISTRIKGN